ncbi:MAG TPA: XRE family transcriptional regulator [Amycolatopsis sp.]|uniref:XRE family transcriptional regulator n=1 Tax=Amycolatopsis sp. TaxID=37632 RepID=UPI002B45A776|nr:XRE family transcriptional regulator [Amycolatopsis sp.]HKS46624.1 XRE family transcriptional regulator [Amycolatopsis sp.]
MSFGQRVRQLRLMHGMTQAELAARVLLNQYKLSRIESGEMSCPEETQQMLAVELGVTSDYLFRPPPVPIETHSPLFRARSRVTQRDKHAAHAWANLINEEYTRLADRNTAIPNRLAPATDLDPVEAAHRTRELLGFTADEPLPYLILAAERTGVRVLGLPFQVPTIDAFCAWHGRTPVVGIMAGVPADRVRFTVAHELGHLILHRGGQTGKQVEDQADAFAAELLTPRHALLPTLPRQPNLTSLTMVKTQWGVSIKALVRRCRELGVIDADRALSLYKQLSKKGWNRKEPGFVPDEKPRGLRKLAELCYGAGPNIERMAAEAGWSEELTVDVLGQHATAGELPRKPRVAKTSGENVVYLRDWPRQAEKILSGE